MHGFALDKVAFAESILFEWLVWHVGDVGRVSNIGWVLDVSVCFIIFCNLVLVVGVRFGWYCCRRSR